MAPGELAWRLRIAPGSTSRSAHLALCRRLSLRRSRGGPSASLLRTRCSRRRVSNGGGDDRHGLPSGRLWDEFETGQAMSRDPSLSVRAWSLRDERIEFGHRACELVDRGGGSVAELVAAVLERAGQLAVVPAG